MERHCRETNQSLYDLTNLDHFTKFNLQDYLERYITKTKKHKVEFIVKRFELFMRRVNK